VLGAKTLNIYDLLERQGWLELNGFIQFACGLQFGGLLMRIMRQQAVLFLMVSFVAVFSFGQEQKPRQITIGFAIEDTKGERWQTDLEEFQQKAEQLGAEVVTRSANGSDDVQFQQVTEMLAGGIDALVILPHDTEKAARMIEAAHAKHVPVLSYDRLAHNTPVDLYVGFDLFQVGELQAQTLVEQAPKGNYLLLGGSPLDFNSKIVRSGQMKVLQPLIDRGDIKVAGDIWVPEWSPTQAYVLVTQALQKIDAPLTAIVASNDGTAGGAIQALEDKGLSGKVLVTGQDADLSAVARLYEGTQLMTVYKPLSGMARTAAEAAVRLAKHQDLGPTVNVPNGERMTKAILFTPVAVTKENAKETVLKDGFQKIESVRQALPKEKQAQLER
jgi:D-xylose transport system substrate-binding protein